VTRDREALDRRRPIARLGRMLDCVLVGVVRDAHFSFMASGRACLPIVSLLQRRAREPLSCAQRTRRQGMHELA